jgi:hypothetical protein
VAGDHKPSFTIAHNNVATFAFDPEPDLFEGADCMLVANAGYFRHAILHCDFGCLNPSQTSFLSFDFQPGADGILDVVQRILTGSALGMTSLKIRT